MNIKVKYYGLPTASLKTREEYVLELNDNATVGRLLHILSEEKNYDDIKACIILVNNTVANEGTVLNNDDELTFVRVLQGG